MASILNFSNTTPAAPTGEALVTWQVDASTPRNTSAIMTPMVGATASPLVNGVGGAVPRPLGTDAAAGKFLRADGTWVVPSAGSGTVTSVGLAAPAFLSVSGSPVTTTGTLTLALANQNANMVFAGPSSGSPAAPTFRALVAADISGSLAKFTNSWTSQTSVTVTHGLGSANVIVQVFDASGNVVQPQTLQVTSTQIILTFGVAFTGSLVAIG